MRIRSTKPEFWRSERIASVSWDARLVLKGLESFVDDNGAGKDDLALIVADVFPRDLSGNPPGTLRRVSEAISELENAGLIWRYEADGTRLLYISFWESIQRIEKPSKGRFVRPDGTYEYKESVIGASFPEPSRNTPGTLPPGTGEQGNRGTGISSASADAEREPESFGAWYERYPRKRSRGQAIKAYRRALKKTDPATLLDAITQQAPTLLARGTEFIPYPATWLNGECWEDDDLNAGAIAQVRYLPSGEEDPSSLPPPERSWQNDRRRGQ